MVGIEARQFENRQSLYRRLGAIRALAAGAMVLLAGAFWVLQVTQYGKYAEMAENNHLRAIPLRAPRGVLYDRDGGVLVSNQSSYTIAIVREDGPRDLSATLARLAQITGADAAQLRDAVRKRRGDPPFRPIPVIEHASFAQIAAVLTRKLELPGVVVQEVPSRDYPAGGLAAHLFGYVGEIRDYQLGQPEFQGLQAGAVVGQMGVERVYNQYLMGEDGNRNVVVNSVGREVDELAEQEPVDGDRLQLTIDADLQRALDEAFKLDGYSGAAVFMNPMNGEIYAMTSEPEYDPNDFVHGIGQAEWDALNNDPALPLENRLIQGRYSPGSTFKIVVATAALSEGVITPDFKVNCTGAASFYGHVFHCDRVHGVLDLEHALQQSCDVYFYTVAQKLSIDTIHKYAAELGLVGKTGIDLPGEVDSFVPDTNWANNVRHERWYPGETISVGIGQGPVSVTPIALSTMISAIANGGTVVTPHVVKAIDRGHGWEALDAPKPRSVFPLPPDVIDPVREGLWLVVNDNGTGVRARVAGHDVVGKTGTAQVISREGAAAAKGKTTRDLRDNSWFTFYASKDHPEIAGVVIAEHAGFGADSAAPIVRYVLETYFAKQEHRPLPTATLDPVAGLTIHEGVAPAPAGAAGGTATPATPASAAGGGGR